MNKTQMVDKSNFDNKQYKADLQCAYDCGYAKGQVDILEKIKIEIQILSFFSKSYNTQMVEMSNVVERIDNHISELKGE